MLVQVTSIIGIMLHLMAYDGGELASNTSTLCLQALALSSRKLFYSVHVLTAMRRLQCFLLVFILQVDCMRHGM